jgi:1-acyl-sn-glycerol-3-phosphate acyltransferase
MPLITKDEFAKVAHLDKYKLSSFSGVLMQLLRIEKLNKIYEKHVQDSPEIFVNHILNELHIHASWDESDLKQLPAGPFIAVCNHPMGGIEGLILLKLLWQHDKESKVLSNYFLSQIPQLKPFVIPADRKVGTTNSKTGISGMRAILKQLEAGHSVGIFPAGEASQLKENLNTIVDKTWDPALMKLIQKAQLPVVPIYIKGSNSMIFHLLGTIHPSLRKARLASEVLNKDKQQMVVRIGKPLKPKEYNVFSNANELSAYLRAKTYALDAAIPRRRFRDLFKQNNSRDAMDIESARPKQLLIDEIAKIKKNRFLFDQNEFEVYIAPAAEIPNVLHEIGRQREITFRLAGEGTNMSIDLDDFDVYYQHLFVWDKEANALVGAYRIGQGDRITRKYGKRGFYLYTLFRMSNEMKPYLAKSLELGRSFIVPAYQKKIYPLFLLWRGIMHFANEHKQYRYLIGPVSISNNYTQLSKRLMVDFITKNHYNDALAKLVKPRKKFKGKVKQVDASLLSNKLQPDFNNLDDMVKYIEANHSTSPVLIKKYLKQGAEIIGFNVDKHFNNALDGFIFLDLTKVPESAKQDYSA